MKRVLIVQPSLQPPGGSNGVAAWTVQALAAHHRVTVLTWAPIDVGPVNRFYGTSLERADFDAISVPATWRRMLDALPVPAALLKNALLMRHIRSVGARFDVIVGTFNENDYGRRGIQYVHYPTYLRPRPEVDLRWYHASGRLLDGYYKVADRIAGFSLERLRSNLTLVNSDWTGSHVSRFLGVSTHTVYPPVVDPSPGAPWLERRSGFLAIGRIAPEKDYERLIRIIARVRERHDVSLTIIGTWDRHARGYFRSLQKLATTMGPWVTFRHDISRDEVRALMASHRYGIHGMREEHFGMAPAEMVRAGMVVWVPAGGGQVEIVNHEALTFADDDEAVEKITRTLDDAQEQARLRDHLAGTAERFSTTRFMERVRSLVETFEG